VDLRILSVGVDGDVGGSAECWTPRVICVTDSVCMVEIRVWRLGDVEYESTSGGRTAVTSRSRAGDVSWYVWWTHRCRVECSCGWSSVGSWSLRCWYQLRRRLLTSQ